MLSRKRIFEIVEMAEAGDPASRTFDLFIIILVLTNVAVIMAVSVASIRMRYASWCHLFEMAAGTIFTIEYGLRIATCTTDERYSGEIRGRLRFAATPLAIIDLLAILPFILPLVLKVDMHLVTFLPIFRLFRLFKLGRYSRSLKLVARVIKSRRYELMATLSIIMVMLVAASSILYFIENQVQPEAFSSIPEAMWWGVATLTTVGYGDVYPITPLGKLFGALIAILGIGMFALPTGIVGSAFVEELHQKKEDMICPHCGKHVSK